MSNSFKGEKLTQKSEVRHEEKDMLECPICLCEHPKEEMYTVQPCGHQFCHECFKAYAKEKVCNISGDLPCAKVGCGSMINVCGLYASGIIDEEILHLYENASFQKTVVKDGTIKQCPKCQIALQITNAPKPGEENKVMCPKCHYQFCRKCSKAVCS